MTTTSALSAPKNVAKPSKISLCPRKYVKHEYNLLLTLSFKIVTVNSSLEFKLIDANVSEIEDLRNYLHDHTLSFNVSLKSGERKVTLKNMIDFELEIGEPRPPEKNIQPIVKYFSSEYDDVEGSEYVYFPYGEPASASQESLAAIRVQPLVYEKIKSRSVQCSGIAKSTGKQCRRLTCHPSGKCHWHNKN